MMFLNNKSKKKLFIANHNKKINTLGSKILIAYKSKSLLK